MPSVVRRLHRSCPTSPLKQSLRPTTRSVAAALSKITITSILPLSASSSGISSISSSSSSSSEPATTFIFTSPELGARERHFAPASTLAQSALGYDRGHRPEWVRALARRRAAQAAARHRSRLHVAFPYALWNMFHAISDGDGDDEDDNDSYCGEE